MNKTSSLRAGTAKTIETRSRAKVAANDGQFGDRDEAPQTFGVAMLAFEGARVRTVTDDAGAVLFAATDVARILGFRCAPDMTRMLDDDEAATHNLRIRSLSGVVQSRSITFITESGLYASALRSRRPAAKRFRKWVTSEVLPSIRKTGAYVLASTAAAVGLDLWRQRMEIERRTGISQKMASTGGRWMREHQVRIPSFKASAQAVDVLLNPILVGLDLPPVDGLFDGAAKKKSRARKRA